MTKSVLLSPFYPVSDKTDVSHRAGWARYWANELAINGEDIELLTTKKMSVLDKCGKGDTVYVYHGMEFKGQLNLQSGLSEDILGRVSRILKAAKRGVKFVSLDEPMPNYGKLFAERNMDPTSSEALTKAFTKASVLRSPTHHPLNVVIGDSHSLSMYRPGAIICRNDGLTMHGALKQELPRIAGAYEFATGITLVRMQTLTLYFGNIDIRHHLLRQPDVKSSIKDMVTEFGKQAEQTRWDMDAAQVEIVMPLPIENECRQIPKSGWYKGTPFFGSWHERHQARIMLRDELKKMAKKRGYLTYEHPRHFVNKQGELPFEVMEQPRSVHIRPSEYRLVQEGESWLV